MKKEVRRKKKFMQLVGDLNPLRKKTSSFFLLPSSFVKEYDK
jgi:hypothetical protein